MSDHRRPSMHGWVAIAVGAVLLVALVAGHVTVFRRVTARYGMSVLVVCVLALMVLIKLGVLGALRARARRRWG